EAATVQSGKIERTVEAVGNLVSNETVMLRPEIAGRVTKIMFEEGASVKMGQPLVQLDDVIARAELAQMQASLTLSRTNFERAKRLFEQDAESGSTRDEALAARDTDQAAVDLAKARVERMAILAPFDGIVGLRVISPGDYVNIGQDLVNIESIDPLKVDLRLPEMYLSALKPGQEIEVTVDAFRDREFKGKVYAINPRVDTNGRTVVLRAMLPNSEMILRPGMFARVQLTLGQSDNALLVPEEALVPNGSKQFVLKINGDQVISTEVETGLRRNGQVEIVKGLKAGDQVVTAGQMKIRPNSKIKILPQNTKAPAQ
ncbi:MAG: efflux transporter periplasmic adaptor subunit, partial [Micavibrio aeruginosavorus]